MATEFHVILGDTPGTLATLGGVLGDARVNIGTIQRMSLALVAEILEAAAQ